MPLRRRALVIVAILLSGSFAKAADDAAASPFGAFAEPPARATIRAHQYTLAECLALADRNFPNLWAARARLALAHGQLEEARWTPWFQWSADSKFGVLPPIEGTVIYPQSSLEARNVNFQHGLQPWFSFGINGTLPLYTFGKIETATAAAEANVRVAEWDMEKWRQAMRMDVRRAYFGLQLARDGKEVLADALERLDKAVRGIKDKLAKGDASVSDTDRLRLEAYREELVAGSLQSPKGEAYALAALRFMTGVVEGFDVPDEPLSRPTRYLAPIAEYLEAARVLRPDVNMARAGLAARKALAGYNRARLFPDFGLGLGADFQTTPSANLNNNAWASDPWNHFYYYFGFGFHWSLDLLPQAARLQQAESQVEETRSLERLAFGNAMYEVERAYADTVEAGGREQAWDRAEHIAKQWISSTQDAIDLGTNDERALLEPLRVYGNARVQHLYALYDYDVSLSNLALASGWDSAAPER
ncbi:MAG: TolC family protein [Polyangiaceae bacterium]|nr:TolC family protein [Polyangiaceae bacterium]